MEDQPDEASGSGSYRTREPTWSEPCTGLLRDPENTPHNLSRLISHELSMALSFLDAGFRKKFAESAVGLSPPNDAWDYLVNVFTKNYKFTFLEAPPVQDETDFNSQLLHAYETMQRVAVGIEQVTLDEAIYKGEMVQDFRLIEIYIVKILCKLHYAMVHQELQPPTTVTKEIMDGKYRDLDSESEMKVRDSVIVKEYNNAINRLKDVFLKFEKQP